MRATFPPLISFHLFRRTWMRVNMLQHEDYVRKPHSYAKNYLYFVTNTCRKIAVKSLLKSDAGQVRMPNPNGMKLFNNLLRLLATSCIIKFVDCFKSLIDSRYTCRRIIDSSVLTDLPPPWVKAERVFK